MLSLISSQSVAFSAPVAPVRHAVSSAAASVRMETVSDLEALAKKCNPVVGYWNPTSLCEMEFWGQSQEATIGFLRQAEIKHGRVAMAAFVGFCLQSNGICFPWALTLEGVQFSDIAAAGGPPAQWDALPTQSKLQIILFIGFLEFWGENSYALGQSGAKHYMRGGKPGVFPKFNPVIPHPVPLELFDPFGFQGKMSEEKKATSLVAEINNGRLAMLGIMGFVAASKVPGSVPVLDGLVAPYAGEPMAPFAASDKLPFVAEMLASSPF